MTEYILYDNILYNISMSMICMILYFSGFSLSQREPADSPRHPALASHGVGPLTEVWSPLLLYQV